MIINQLKEISKRSKTALLWQKWFPDEPFDREPSNEEFPDFTTSLSYDIVQASRRQQVFFYQVNKRTSV